MSVRESWRRVRLRVAPPYGELIAHALGDADSVLDVGCGPRSPLAPLRDRLEVLAGVDAHAPSLEQARRAGTHTEYHLVDVLRIEELGAGSFDAVAAVDLLEHLEKADGERLLQAMETVARRRVVLFTPNGFVPQGTTRGNPWQVHLSGWTTAELRERGYAVTGVHGLRPLRAEEAAIRFRPRRFWHLVADLTEPVARRWPELAFHLLAVRELA